MLWLIANALNVSTVRSLLRLLNISTYIDEITFYRVWKPLNNDYKQHHALKLWWTLCTFIPGPESLASGGRGRAHQASSWLCTCSLIRWKNKVHSTTRNAFWARNNQAKTRDQKRPILLEDVETWFSNSPTRKTFLKSLYIAYFFII